MTVINFPEKRVQAVNFRNVSDEDDTITVWECPCGGHLFYILEEEFTCAKCETAQRF